MDVFDLVATIKINLEEFDRGLNEASKKFKSFSDSLTKIGTGMKSILDPAVKGFKAVEDVGQKAVDTVKKGLAGFAAASTAVSGFGVSAVKAGMSFDATMSEVSAISGATGEDFDALRDKALEMGAKTKFSASEAAEAMTYMGMAGWKTGDILEGIAGIMNLAAASGEDLATTSDIVTDALTAFGKQAGYSGEFANILAATATSANTNVGMMGETFKYVAPVAGALGYEVSDTAEAIGLMANAGIKSTQAGTSLRSILTRLSTDAGASSKSLGALGTLTEKLGVEFYNTDGSARDLNAVLDESRAAWAGLTEEQQINYGKVIAGQEAMSGWLALMNAAPADIEKLSTALNDCNDIFVKTKDGAIIPMSQALEEGIEWVEEYEGAAAKMAATMVDNLQGDLTLLGSAFESLQIAISDSLTPTLREFAQFGQQAMASLLEGFQSNGLDGLFTELTTVVTNGLSMLAEQAPKFAEVSMQFLAAMGEGLINAFPDILAAAQKISSQLVSGFTDFIQSHSSDIVKIGSSIIDFISEGFGVADAVIPMISDFIVTIADGISSHVSDLFDTGLLVITTVIDGIVQHIDEVREIAGELIANIIEGISSSAPSLIEGGTLIIQTLLEEITSQIPQIMESGIEIITMLLQGIAEMVPQLITAAAEIISSLIQGIADNLPQILDAAGEIIGGLVEGITQALPQIAEAAVALIQSFAEYIRENLPTIIETGLELLTEFSGSLRENIGLIIDAAVDLMLALAQGLADGLPAIIEYVPEIVSNIANIINDNAPKILEAGLQIIATLALGLIQAIPVLIENIPKIIGAIVDVITAFNWLDLGGKIITGLVNGIKALLGDVTTTAGMIIENITTVLSDLPGYLKTIGEDVIHGLVDGIKSGFTWVVDHITQLVELLLGTIKNLLGIHSPSTVFSEIGENIIEGLLNGIKETFEGVLEFFNGAWESIQEIFSDVAEVLGGFFSDAWDAIQAAWDGAAEFFGNIWSNIKEVGSEAANTVRDALKEAWNSIKEAWDSATEFFKGIYDDIVGVFDGIGDKFKSIGSNIVNGIKDGVTGAWNNFVSFMSDKISGIINSVKEKLGIHSPSRVFAGIGENMALGLAAGWEEEYRGIKRQIENGMEFTPASVGLNASGPSYNSANGYDSGSRPLSGGNTYVTINSPKAVDAVTAAREWKKTTQRMAIGYV